MRLFQINTKVSKSAPKVARYYKMSDYEAVIDKMWEMYHNKEIIDFEIIR